MGSYADLQIAGYPFLCSKSFVDDTLMTLFDECDRRVYQRRLADRNPLSFSIDPDEDQVETGYEYQLNAEAAKDRLELLGFSIDRAKTAFQERIDAFLQELEDDGVVLGLSWIEDEDEKRNFLAEYTFDQWGNGIRRFLDSKLDSIRWNQEVAEKLDTVLRLVAGAEEEEFLYGFPRCDPRLFMRAVLEVTDAKSPVVLDFTDLVAGGYYEGDEELSNLARSSIRQEFVATTRTVVLTEGTTDAEFLSKSLQVLHPHLVPLFTFVDFATPNMEGGAANLMRIVKGFIAGGVANRVVAVFDNDTAAADVLRSFSNVETPENIRVLQYPPLAYAERYPTIGPQGTAEIDVNGLAGSVELYFGTDVLQQDDGTLTPVQWRGYNQQMRRYQGELVDKRRLQDVFRRKVNSAKQHSNPRASADWTGMEAILQAVLQACRTDETKIGQ